jgi:phosphoribosyl-dephospho-CoA transferase
MMRLRRHDLVWLSAQGWEDHVLGQAADTVARACLAHWYAKRLPLVVGRQTLGEPELALGLAAPGAWERRKLPAKVPRDCVLYHDRFAKAAEIRHLLAARLRHSWLELCGELAAQGTDPRVHGSFGWQRITGLEYITPQSDIDLHLSVRDADIADRIASVLDRFKWKGPRIDGELLFPNGDGVAWREWLQWRRGGVSRIMVKRLHGVAMEEGLQWCHDHSALMT